MTVSASEEETHYAQSTSVAPLRLLSSPTSRERETRKKKRAAPRRAGRCVTHSREEHIRDPHCERNAIKLRRTDRVIFVELLEREEVKGSRCVCAQRIRASCVAHCISASQT